MSNADTTTMGATANHADAGHVVQAATVTGIDHTRQAARSGSNTNTTTIDTTANHADAGHLVNTDTMVVCRDHAKQATRAAKDSTALWVLCQRPEHGVKNRVIRLVAEVAAVLIICSNLCN